MKSNLASYLEEQKRLVREKRIVQTVSAEERQQLDDLRKVLSDPSLTAKYQGEFIVAHAGKVVAHGTDWKAVLDQAAKKTGKSASEIPVVFIDYALEEAPH